MAKVSFSHSWAKLVFSRLWVKTKKNDSGGILWGPHFCFFQEGFCTPTKMPPLFVADSHLWAKLVFSHLWVKTKKNNSGGIL